MRSVVIRSAVLFATASLALGVAAVPASAVTDRDCGDFSSQKAAQIFYLNAGGPRVDPHRLDSEGDGVACESTPAPYYYGSSLPGGSGGYVAFSTFHPMKKVTAHQVAPHKMKFVNRTPWCQALTITYRNGSSETARLWYTRETQRLIIGGTVKSVRVYRPGC